MGKKIIIKGRVQGVGCRGYCMKYARKFRIKGSATNMSDGSVELLLDCDNLEYIKSYLNALIANPDDYYFFGSILDVKVSDYTGDYRGDYRF